MQTRLPALWKADISYNLTPTIYIPEGTLLKWHQDLYYKFVLSRLEGVRFEEAYKGHSNVSLTGSAKEG